MDTENLNTYHIIKEERDEDYNEFTEQSFAPNEVNIYVPIYFIFEKNCLFLKLYIFLSSTLNLIYKILGPFTQYTICNISTVPHVCSKIE